MGWARRRRPAKVAQLSLRAGGAFYDWVWANGFAFWTSAGWTTITMTMMMLRPVLLATVEITMTTTTSTAEADDTIQEDRATRSEYTTKNVNQCSLSSSACFLAIVVFMLPLSLQVRVVVSVCCSFFRSFVLCMVDVFMCRNFCTPFLSTELMSRSGLLPGYYSLRITTSDE